MKKKHDEAASKVLQLEEDIMTVTQKAIAKETELDRYLFFCSLPSLFYLFSLKGVFLDQRFLLCACMFCINTSVPLIFQCFSLKDKLKKVMLEKEQLECVLKTEKDEKELYKVILLLVPVYTGMKQFKIKVIVFHGKV